MFNPVERDLDSFIRTFRAQSKMSRDPPLYPNSSINDTQKSAYPLPSLSARDIQKMKYKIELDKQVAEKQERSSREWETKFERDKKYVKQQAFLGRQDSTSPIKKQDLEDIYIQSHIPSPLILKKPEQLSRHYQYVNVPNGNNQTETLEQPNYYQYSRPPKYSTSTTKFSTSENIFPQTNRSDFQRLNGSNTYVDRSLLQGLSSTTAASHGVKSDAHDPFISFDPNKEPQQVFNIIPQQNLYEPWGRPGAGAPLVHQETGQKFTRYAGSLEEKLNTIGPLSFYRNQYGGNINDQKHDMEVQQRRRQQEQSERKLNAGDTADWISHIEGSHYPLRFHLPSTKTTRHISGTHDPYMSEETRSMRDALARQTEERARVEQITRYEENIAELHHTEVQNNWWSKDGAKPRNRRLNAPGQPRTKWIKNHLGEVTFADDKPSSSVNYYGSTYSYPKTDFVSKHTNYYQLSDSKNS